MKDIEMERKSAGSIEDFDFNIENSSIAINKKPTKKITCRPKKTNLTKHSNERLISISSVEVLPIGKEINESNSPPVKNEESKQQLTENEEENMIENFSRVLITPLAERTSSITSAFEKKEVLPLLFKNEQDFLYKEDIDSNSNVEGNSTAEKNIVDNNLEELVLMNVKNGNENGINNDIETSVLNNIKITYGIESLNTKEKSSLLRKRNHDTTSPDGSIEEDKDDEDKEKPSKVICLNKTPVFHNSNKIVFRKEDIVSSNPFFSPSSFQSIKSENEVHFSPIIKNNDETFVLFPNDCLNHDTLGHQENFRRLEVLCGKDGILKQGKFIGSKLRFFENCEDNNSLDEGEFKDRVKLIDILRVHEVDYWNHLKKRCAEQNIGSHHSNANNNKFDFDTRLSSGTMDAILSAAGACIAAVDQVATGKCKNVFCATRPPGHHAGSRGAVAACNFHSNPEMCSNGFCFLNNAAIAASYARSTYGRLNPSITTYAALRRIAIVDFDIHHGNGTEEIIRNLVPRKATFPLPSSWAPQTYDAYKPWLDENDADNVFLASIHLVQEDFYPGDGVENFNYPRILNLPLYNVGEVNEKSDAKNKAKQMNELHKRASLQFKTKVTEELIPALNDFKPDLIIISAGFDGHLSDFYYFLDEFDYEFITKEIKNVAEKHCEGRIISILEGGYHVEEVETIKNVVSKSSRGRVKKETFKESPVNVETTIEKEKCGLALSVAAHVLVLME